jgi:steroid delta-isomerase-like uncharacterized protein
VSTKTKPASTDAAEVARSYFEAVGRQDLDAMEAHYEPGSVGRIHGLVELKVGDNYRAWFAELFRAFPDWKFEILDIVAEGERAAVEWGAKGTFNGDGRFQGFEPNGATIEIRGCDVVTVRDGRMVGLEAYTDGMDIARQLGAMPPQGSIAERGMTGALNLKTRASKLLKRD